MRKEDGVTERVLGDVRILKLAEMYERAYEAFVLEMAERYVQDPDVRARLAKLTASTDKHGERIAAEIERLNAQLTDADRLGVERAALQDVIEVERAAREFYLRFLEEVHDKGVADLFRALAREEAAHVRIAEAALGVSDRKAGRPHVGEATERLLRLVEDAPSWEGSIDFGSTRMARRPPG